jgi:Tol biopolymer transport system component
LGAGYPGTPRLLDTAGVEVEWCGFTWSADGQWIAFNGKEVKEGYQRIYLVSADGGKPKQVHENNRDARVVNYRMSLSPHGETLAFASVDANELHIYTLSVDGGSPEKLVDARAREPVFSPDGKMIAYVEDKALGRAGGGLWVVPADGGTPTLVADVGNASSPVWSPDGAFLAFVDYAADKQIHIVPLEQDGSPAGEEAIIDCPEGIERVRRLAGWTPDNEIGAIFGTQMEFALYTQAVQGGKATFVTHGGHPSQPRWSPDGKRIIHVNNTSEASADWQAHAIAYISAEGGDVTTVALHSESKIRLQGYGTGNHISPDGKTIVFAGHKASAPIPTMHIWTLPIDGGTPRQLTDAPLPFRDWYPCWSPDGQNIAFVRMKVPENWAVTGKGNIYIVSADGGEPRQITSESDRVFAAGPVLWSPDGTLLAYFSRDKDDAADGTLKVIPPDGGKPQIVAKVNRIYANKEMAWSPDSRRIAYNAPGNKIKIVSLDDGSIVEIEPDLKNVNIYHLDWSPDGENLVFAGYTGGGPEFWLVENFLPKTKTSE